MGGRRKRRLLFYNPSISYDYDMGLLRSNGDHQPHRYSNSLSFYRFVSMHAVVISPIQYHSAGQIKFPQDKRPIYQMFSKSTFTVNFLSSISASATMRRYVHHVESETVSATMVSAQWTVYYTLSPLFRDQPLTPHREYENVIPETGRRSPSLVHMHTKYLPTILFKINLHPLFVKRQMPCDYVLCVSIQHSANRLTYNSICI